MSEGGRAEPCPGAPLEPDRVIGGEFGTDLQGAYVLLPFDVPAGTTSVRVKYCYDQPETPASQQFKHTLDLALYDARRRPGALFAEEEFRGSGGSSHPDVTVSPRGFSSEEEYLRDPKGHVEGRTTRGFLPGPVPAGEWAVELGVAAVVGRDQGDLDGKVAWRVEIDLSRDPSHSVPPYRPATYDSKPAIARPGWYAGDLHVHAEHSALGDATMRETFDYAFAAPPVGAGLDFVTLSDYVTSSAWGEIGRHQERYPDKLVARSAEMITYRGHANNHVSARYVDYRTGPVYERRADGLLEQRRDARQARDLFADVLAAGGFTQVNHPTIFPSEVPAFGNLCRGCPWDYSDAQTDWGRVDAYEVHTGPPGTPEPEGNELGPNPFTVTAIEEFDRLRRLGHWTAAVAVSDSHHAGRTPNPVTQAPVGVGTTVVHAPELSEEGIRRGVQAGHTYAKVFGPDSPDLRLEARNQHGTAIMGDGLLGDSATLVARVVGGAPTAAPRTLLVLRDGAPIATVPVVGHDFTHEMTVSGTGDYRIQVMRGTAPDALTTPVRLGRERPSAPAGSAAPRLRLRVTPVRTRARRQTVFRFRVTAGGRGVEGARVRLGGRHVRTGRSGRAAMRMRFARPGRRTARADRRGYRPARVPVRVRRAVADRRPRFAG